MSIALTAIVSVTVGTVGLGLYAVRLARTTSDLFGIPPGQVLWNAAATSGEYLSAASFLGAPG